MVFRVPTEQYESLLLARGNARGQTQNQGEVNIRVSVRGRPRDNQSTDETAFVRTQKPDREQMLKH